MTDPKDLEAVRALVARRGRELMDTHRAEGVGVGRQGDGYVIVVYLASSRQLPEEPASLEGVPLRFEITGRFTTQTP